MEVLHVPKLASHHHPYLVVVVGAKVDGNKGEPHDAGAVHGESDILGLVKVLRDLAGFEGVQGAQDDQGDVVDERHHQGERGHLAGEDGSQWVRVDLFDIGPFNHQPHDGAHQLDEYDAW